MLIKKPFLSILYVLRSLILCSRILECSKLKYNSYLRLLSAKWRSRSIPVSYLEISLSGWRCQSRVTQLSETLCCATALPKFFKILLVGGTPSLICPSTKPISSSSCCRLRFRRCSAASVPRGCCAPRCLRDNVVQSTPNIFATWRYEKLSPASRDSIYSIASWIGSMVVELWRVEVETTHNVGMVGWLVTRSGSSRARLV